jgi:dephospho-CoA kinase
VDQDLAQKKIVGIIGGIGSGKSTVAAEFLKLGCAVIDADALVHRFLDEKPVQQRIAKALKTSPLNESGPLNRRKIARLVFDNPENLAKLNSILHPRVLEETEQLIEKYRKTEEISAIILDMPLLLEMDWAKRCDRIIFVECPENLRYQRIQKKRNLSVKDIKMRENFQISLDKKHFQADTTISNNADYAVLVRQVIEIFSDIVKNC